MAFVQHRHDQMHRGQVPADQLATGTPEHGDVPVWNEYDDEVQWGPQDGGPGGGAPTDVDYLVGTASGDLSAEIVVGTTPGGELGGSWASPTVDATHSGSSHAGIQAAAEATAAGYVSDHTGDTTDAHDASAISVLDTAGHFTATDVEAALAELAVAGSGDLTSLVVDLSVSGAHEVDRDDGDTHDLTLTGDATLTLAGALVGEATDLRILLRQDGTGGREVTWPGSIEWQGGAAPTLQTDPDAVDVIGLVTVDDGTSWLGFHASSGTSITWGEAADISTLAFDDVPAAGTTGKVADAGHVHGMPAAPTGGGSIGPLLITDTPSTPLVFADLIQNEAQDDLVYADT